MDDRIYRLCFILTTYSSSLTTCLTCSLAWYAPGSTYCDSSRFESPLSSVFLCSHDLQAISLHARQNRQRYHFPLDARHKRQEVHSYLVACADLTKRHHTHIVATAFAVLLYRVSWRNSLPISTTRSSSLFCSSRKYSGMDILFLLR